MWGKSPPLPLFKPLKPVALISMTPLPSRKEPRHAEVLAEDGGGTDCVVEEGSHKFQLRPRDRLQK